MSEERFSEFWNKLSIISHRINQLADMEATEAVRAFLRGDEAGAPENAEKIRLLNESERLLKRLRSKPPKH